MLHRVGFKDPAVQVNCLVCEESRSHGCHDDQSPHRINIDTRFLKRGHACRRAGGSTVCTYCPNPSVIVRIPVDLGTYTVESHTYLLSILLIVGYAGHVYP